MKIIESLKNAFKKKWVKIVAIAAGVVVIAGATTGIVLGVTSQNNKNLANNFVVGEENTITLNGTKGTDIPFPENPSKTGYIFKGWYVNSDFSGLPVTSGKFDGKTTYYALWVKASAITLDADGGSCDVTMLYLEEGVSVSEVVSEITPTKEGHQFAGWYIGDNAINENLKAVDGIVLKARYKTKYIIKAQLTSLNGETYEDILAEGYAFAGETISSDYSVEGFSALSEPTLVVSENYEQNVLTITFSRNKYFYTVYEKYPDGTSKTLESKQVYYETTVELPSETLTAPEGYRFIGWADKEDAVYNEALTGETYVVKGEVGIYPVWDKAYTDTFGGDDYLFIDRDKENSATLVRGTVSINGTYDSAREMYTFNSSDPDFSLRIKLDEKNHRFIYYAVNPGKYYLYDFNNEKYYNEKDYILFLKYNEVEYYSDDASKKNGTYSVTDGTYEVVFEDGTSMRFLLGKISDGTMVYRVRGKEYSFGTISLNSELQGLVTFTLDGFGNAALTYNGSTQSYTYTISQKEGEEKYYVTLAYNNQTLTFRVTEKDGRYVYDVYKKELDAKYNIGTSKVYVFDGCGYFDYTENGQVKGSGTYTASSSLLGGYVAILTMNDKKTVYYLGEENLLKIKHIEEKDDNYAEYYYCNDESRANTEAVIVLNGEEAVVYQKNGSDNFEVVSDGDLVANDDGSYTYKRKNVKKSDAIVSFETMTFNVDSSTGYNYFYILEADGETAESKKDYISEDGCKLVLVSAFGIYTDKDGVTFKGYYKKSDSYSYITDGKNYKYFIIEENDKFYALSGQPMELAKIEDGKTDYNTTLVVTGKQIGEDAYEAIYTAIKTVNNEKITEKHEGSFIEKEIKFLDVSYYVDVFTASDGSGFSFKFFRSSKTLMGYTIMYFNYFESDETMEIASFIKIDDDDSENTKVKFILTDETSDGTPIVVYEDENGNRIKGTFGERVEVYAFGEEGGKYKADKYKFTPLDASSENAAFDFTLLGTGYFRVCAEDATYNSETGGKLELDGATHIARYTAKGSKKPSYNTYLLIKGVLGEKAVYTYIGETAVIFDLEGDKFYRRGDEADVYYVVKNASLTKQYVSLNGQGGATLYDSNVKDDEGVAYTYEFIGENVVLYSDEKKQAYIGKLSSETVSGSTIDFFTILTDGFSGAYLCEKDLSVLVLDDAGNVIKYTSYGQKTVGDYKALDDGIIYYCNEDATDAGVYILADGKATASVFDSENGYNESYVSAAYYADDFSSIIFYSYGMVLYNNTTSKFFVYDEKTEKLKTYETSDADDANSYGFKSSETTLGNSMVFNDKTYYIFDGTQLTFTEGDKELKFQPTGGAEFTVEATITEGSNTDKYYVIVSYNSGETEPNVYLAKTSGTYTDSDGKTQYYTINGGTDNYTFTVNYDLAVKFEDNSFTSDMDNYMSGIVAYNYDYVSMYSTYGSSYSSIISQIYGGKMGLIANIEGGQIKFSVWGWFNFIYVDSRDESGELVYNQSDKKVKKQSLVFSNGELSKAGEDSDGHLYVVEFKIGTEEKYDKYHLLFRLYDPSTVSNGALYVFKVISVSKVTNEFYLNEEKTSVYYEEAYVYTSAKVLTGTKDENGNDEYYNGTTANGSYLPTLRVDGELIPSNNISDKGGYRRFYYSRYSDNKQTDAVYYFNPTTDESGNVTGGTLDEYYKVTVKDKEGKEVAVTVYTDGEKIVEIVSFEDVKGGYDAIVPESYEIDSDGTATVVINDPDYPNRNGTYKLTFAKDENGKVVSVSYEKNV